MTNLRTIRLRGEFLRAREWLPLGQLCVNAKTDFDLLLKIGFGSVLSWDIQCNMHPLCPMPKNRPHIIFTGHYVKL